MNLESLNNIFLFGKPRAFSLDEFSSQMSYHNITIITEFDDNVELLVEGRMMTPYEQNISDELYKTKDVTFISIDVLEKALAEVMDEATLLMSLKLSHDKERLKSFIQNSMLADTLFLKLIKMYKWRGEDFFENDDNRDVSAAFISRFYENIERNHNVQFATTGFIHLVAQAKTPTLLNAIFSLEPCQFHPKISRAVAMSMYCDEVLQNKLFKKEDESLNEALSLNKNLIYPIAVKFLESADFGENVARNINLNEELFVQCSSFLEALAENESLNIEMQTTLFAKNIPRVHLSLAKNLNLNSRFIKKLLQLKDEEIKQNIYANSVTSVEILQEAYQNECNYMALAKNENTPIEILYQLQLDSKYERYVKTNAGYGRHIQTENIGWLV